MEKQLYVSFVHEREKNLRRLWRGLAIVFVSALAISVTQGFVIPSYADTKTSESLPVDPSKLDPEFLLLPAFELERVVDPQEALNQKEKEKQGVQVGDELRLRVTGVQLPGIQNPSQELKVDTPSGINLSNEGWEIELTSELDFLATPIKPGRLTLPSLALKDSKGKALGRTNPFTVDVRSAIKEDDPQPTQPVDMEPPVGLKFPTWIVVILIGVTALVLAAVAYAVYLWWKKRKPKSPQSNAVKLSEDEAALNELAQLAKQELLKKGQFKSHYFKVSEILKAYVGERYLLDALESTTQEMIVLLEKNSRATGDSVIDRLESLFNKLDRVKFTDHVPDVDESSQLINEAKEFVLNTRRMPIVPGTVNQTTGVETRAV